MIESFSKKKKDNVHGTRVVEAGPGDTVISTFVFVFPTDEQP